MPRVIDWQTRKEVGDQHEQYLARELEKLGWTVHLCGQGTWPTTIQRALQRGDSALRQFPDLLAARGNDLVAIDAKTRLPSTTSNRYAVSRKCVTAGLQFLGANAPTPLYYVFGDLRVLTPVEVMHYSNHALRHTSGAYYLINTHQAHSFDEVFGPTGLEQAA